MLTNETNLVNKNISSTTEQANSKITHKSTLNAGILPESTISPKNHDTCTLTQNGLTLDLEAVSRLSSPSPRKTSSTIKRMSIQKASESFVRSTNKNNYNSIIKKPEEYCSFCKLYGGRRKRPLCSRESLWPKYDNLITKCEIIKQNAHGNVWIFANNFVYNVSDYIHKHPGGPRAIQRRSDSLQDCAIDFKFHSPTAKKVWNSLTVGKLIPCEPKESCLIS
eukprot:maker-scaffold_14-snap-gene-7.21-mRNA-1 protein AED:0.32 eAED:0.32 QI:31/1/1/1/1/1/2/20/221